MRPAHAVLAGQHNERRLRENHRHRSRETARPQGIFRFPSALAIAIGAIAGLYPAMRASKLAPTDALRA